jgi:hypothetical protein
MVSTQAVLLPLQGVILEEKGLHPLELRCFIRVISPRESLYFQFLPMIYCLQNDQSPLRVIFHCESWTPPLSSIKVLTEADQTYQPLS